MKINPPAPIETEEASLKEVSYEALQVMDSISVEEEATLETSDFESEPEYEPATLTGWDKFKNFFRKKPATKMEEDIFPEEDNSATEIQKFQKEDEEDTIYEVKPLHIGLFYPLSNHFTDAGKYVNRLSFQGLVGLSKGLDGVEASGFGNITEDFVKGVQLSGFFNVVGERVEGVQAAGFINVNGGTVEGAQFAGFLNIGGDSARSGNFAGFGNINGGPVTGGQFAGFINMAESVKGIQAAGFINTTIQDVEGVQLSGFINRARNVKGVQIGIVNFADSVDGVSIGIFNFVRRGYRRIEVFGSESWHGNLAFKFGVQNFYTILAAGVQFQENNDYTWGYGFGFGSQLDLSNRWKISIDATTFQVKEEGTWRINYLNLHNNLRIGFDRQFSKHFTLFMGPSFNLMVSRQYDPETMQFGSDFPPYHVFNKSTSTTNIIMWPGFFIGIRI
ncbi:hypothetical protein BH23BAC1_BH23BAC1_05470 [soil metagenome]